MTLDTTIIIYGALSVPVAISLWVACHALGKPQDALGFALFASTMVVTLGLWTLAGLTGLSWIDVTGDAVYVAGSLLLTRAVAGAKDDRQISTRMLLYASLAVLVLLAAVEIVPGGRAYRLSFAMVLAGSAHAWAATILVSRAVSKRRALERTVYLVFALGIALLLFARGTLYVLTEFSSNLIIPEAQALLLLGFGLLYNGLFFSVIIFGLQRLVRRLADAQDRVGSRERWGTVTKLSSGIVHEVGTTIGALGAALSSAGAREYSDTELAAAVSESGRRLSVSGRRISLHEAMLMDQTTGVRFDIADALRVAAEASSYADTIECRVDCPAGLRAKGRGADLAISTMLLLRQGRLVPAGNGGPIELLCDVHGDQASIEFSGIVWPAEVVDHLESYTFERIENDGGTWGNLDLVLRTVQCELDGEVEATPVRGGYRLGLRVPVEDR